MVARKRSKSAVAVVAVAISALAGCREVGVTKTQVAAQSVFDRLHFSDALSDELAEPVGDGKQFHIRATSPIQQSDLLPPPGYNQSPRTPGTLPDGSQTVGAWMGPDPDDPTRSCSINLSAPDSATPSDKLSGVLLIMCGFG